MIVPLEPGSSFLKFKVNLSGLNLTIKLKWLTRFGFYSVDIYDGPTPLVKGKGLHPDTDLLAGLDLGIGSLYLSGEAATPRNLGLFNELRYDE